MPKTPTWKLPKNIAKAVQAGDGMWEDDRWSPILLTAMSGTEFNGRAIPMAWQIEFYPFNDELEAASEIGRERDGARRVRLGEHVRKTIEKSDPALAKRLNLTDCETDTCVIWVESQDDCRILIESAWKLIQET